MQSSQTRKFLTFTVLAATGISMMALLINSVDISMVGHTINADSISPYSLNLTSSNSVSSNGDHVIRSATGGQVRFTYTSVSGSSGNHCAITAGGSIVNKDIIHSIKSISATFEGTLQARIAYVTTKWGEYFNLVSGKAFSLGTNPYYIEFNATTDVVLKSAFIGFSCEVNADAEVQETSGSYDITFATNSSDSSSNIGSSSSSIMAQVASGSNYISSFSDGDRIYAGKSGLKFGASGGPGSVTINFNSTNVAQTITTIDVATAQYSSDSGKFNVYVNGSSSYTQITPSAGGSVSVNAALSSLTIETATKRAYLCGLTLNYGGTIEPGAPETPDAVEIGFSASDANKQNYTTNSIFDNENALDVYAIFSDGSHNSLPKGGANGYSYVIKNSNDVAIDSSVKFPAEGVYTLVVSYSNYIPVEIEFTVGEYVYAVDVAASMSTTTFTTADILSENLADNLTATMEYSDGSSSTSIAYADFASNGLGVKLTTKYGTTYDMTKPFGTEGNWTLKVYDITNEEMYYNIALTVNAIPVETIGLSETSKTMYPGETVELVATVNPSNATKLEVVWASNNEAVATVDEEGVVTAVAVGGANITATSTDGTNVVATCAITVIAAPSTETYSIDATTTTQVTTNSTSSVVFTNSPVTVTIAKSSSSTNANNYVGGTNDYNHTRVYSGQRLTISAGGNEMSKVVIHGTSAKGINGLTSPTWTNANKTWDGYELTLTPTDTKSDIYCPVSGTCSFSGIDVTIGGSEPVTPVYPTAITVSGTSSSISIGGTSQLSVTYTPSDTNVKNVTWSSSNTSVATVSSAGLVTGIAQGSATITATAEAENGTVSKTYTITVNPVAVTSVSMSDASATVKAGKTITLAATVNPSNATNKNLNWSSSNTSIATVNSSGVVTGVAAGTATITATSAADSSKKATCIVTVTAAAGGEETFEITYTDLPTTYQTGSTVYTADSGIKFQAYNCANYSSKMQFKASSGYLQNTEDLELQSLTINNRESNTLTVYGSNTAGSFSTEITGSNDVYDLSGYSYFKVARTASGAAYCSSLTIVTGTPVPTDPTSIIMSPASAEVGIGGTKQLSVSYVPSNANQNKEITWTSSNTNVATVNSDGLVSVKSTATAGQTATITAKLTNLPAVAAVTCTITVIEQQKDDHTVLIYICGADLESENQLATGDIQEILKVSGQPDDVNIVIETGGANSWASTYGISSTKLERWHVENRSLIKDDSLTYASMGLTSTLQSFLEYGLSTYPAERTGVVFWNHGGGMRGVCYDEKKNDDVLKNSEIRSAISGALNNCGMSGQKLEWVGYDACLMAVQDIAETNSDYFNYMIASEESEAGYGWDYDNWVDDLYAKKTTTTILKAIVDSFISDNGGASSSSGDQTLSYLNLAYASAYKTAWENMAAQLNNVVTTSNKSSFNSAITSNVKHYADSDYDYFCTFDAWDFVDKLANNSAFSSFRIDSSYTTAVKNAHANLVAYSVAQKGAGVSKGLCMYWPNSTQYSDVSTYYTTSETRFSTWRSFCVNKGTHA